VGLPLKCTGDMATLTLIQGGNLDAGVNQEAINLTDQGLQRLRTTLVSEMDETEVKRVGRPSAGSK
jgi:hypothetical protein